MHFAVTALVLYLSKKESTMRLVTGDECGLLKECIPELSRKEEDENPPSRISKEGVKRVDNRELQTRKRGVVDVALLSGVDDSLSLSFAALRQNGCIDFLDGDISNRWSYGEYDKNLTVNNVFSDTGCTGKPRPLGLGFFRQQNRICAGDMFGNITIINGKNGKIVEQYNGYATSKGRKTVSYTPGNNINAQLATAICCDPVNGRVAIGGRERETTLLDLSTGNIVFKAKNLPPDPQTLLQHPVWPTSILFFDGSSVMAVGTGYKEVRLYDVRENSKIRRPSVATPEGLFDYRVTSLCQVDDNRLVVGDAGGSIYDLDIRTLDRNPKRTDNNNIGRYVGPGGSVRQLKKHPTLPRLAAVGLDRMLRIYDTTTRKQLDNIYMVQRLNCVLFSNDDTWESGKLDRNHVEEDDSDIDQDDVVEDYVDSDSCDSQLQDNVDEVVEDGVDAQLRMSDDYSGSSKSDDCSTPERSSEISDSDDSESEDDEVDASRKRQRRQ